VPAIEHELLGAETRTASLLVQRDDVLLELVPRRGGVDVDLDDTGIRRDLERSKRRIAGGS
jgi:hypothetical protein